MKRIQFLFIILQIGVVLPCYSQTRNIEWEKSFNQRPNSTFIDITKSDEGYVILGSSENNHVSTPMLVKLNEFGELVWEKVFNSGENMTPKCIEKTGSNGYVIAGIINADQSQEEIFMIRTDLSGNEIWRKKFINQGRCLDGKLITLKNNNFFLAGTIQKEDGNQFQMLMMVDSLGISIWEKSIIDEELIYCRSVKQLPDGTIALAQEIVQKGNNNSDIQVTRINELGEIVWKTRIPGKDARSWPECICCSDDNCLLVVGWHGTAFNDINAENPIIDYDLQVNKIDKNGKLLWSKNFDSEGSEGGNNIAVNSDGSIFIAGKKETSFSGKIGPWVVCLDKEGNLIEDILIPFHFNNDQAQKIIITPDNGFVVIGPGLQKEKSSRAFAWVMKFASL